MKSLPSFLLLLFSTAYCCAQSEGFRYGGRFGLGVSRFTDESLDNQSGKLSFNAGLTANYQFVENFGLALDALFVSKGTKAGGTETRSSFTGSQTFAFEDTYRLFYAEVPLMIKASAGFNNFYLKAFVGPSLNFNLLGTYSRDYDDPDEDDLIDNQIKGLSVTENAIVYGAGMEVEMADKQVFFLDIRNSTGLTSFGTVTSNGKEGYNRYFSVGVGYLY